MLQPQATASSLFEFKWAPTSAQIKFELLGKHGQKSCANHFEHHACLTEKANLYKMVSKFCESQHRDYLDFLPLTFVIDFANRSVLETGFEKFMQTFNVIEKMKSSSVQEINFSLTKLHSLMSKQMPGKNTSEILKETMFDGANLWVLKPSDCNRGRGVTIFSRLEDIKQLVLENADGMEVPSFAKIPGPPVAREAETCFVKSD